MSKDRAETSRQNGSRSRGPISLAGKVRASQNARRHGVLAKERLLPGESQAEWDALMSDLGQELGAEGIVEWQFIERMAESIWRQRRLVRAERAQILFQTAASVPVGPYKAAALADHPGVVDSNSPEAMIIFKKFAMALAGLSSNSDHITRYQSALDHSFAKALKGFREAQDYRLRSLPAANDSADLIIDDERR